MGAISFEVNNNGKLTFEQSVHDGSVDVITWDRHQDFDGDVIRCTVRHGEVVSAGDMVMLMNYYRHQKKNGLPIF